MKIDVFYLILIGIWFISLGVYVLCGLGYCLIALGIQLIIFALISSLPKCKTFSEIDKEYKKNKS